MWDEHDSIILKSVFIPLNELLKLAELVVKSDEMDNTRYSCWSMIKWLLDNLRSPEFLIKIELLELTFKVDLENLWQAFETVNSILSRAQDSKDEPVESAILLIRKFKRELETLQRLLNYQNF